MGLSSPDFVILGTRTSPDAVMVMASDRLTLAELETETQVMEQVNWTGLICVSETRITYTLTSRMTQVHLARAADYPTAMAILFREWSPLPAISS